MRLLERLFEIISPEVFAAVYESITAAIAYDTGDGADARRILDVMSDYAEGPDYDAGWPDVRARRRHPQRPQTNPGGRMTPEEMFIKLEYLPDVQIEEYELEGAVDTDLTLPAGHVIMTRFGHVEWGGIRRRTYVWEYGEEATEYYLCNPRSDTPHSHRFVARSSLRLISPEDAETTAEQPAVHATEATQEPTP